MWHPQQALYHLCFLIAIQIQFHPSHFSCIVCSLHLVLKKIYRYPEDQKLPKGPTRIKRVSERENSPKPFYMAVVHFCASIS